MNVAFLLLALSLSLPAAAPNSNPAPGRRPVTSFDALALAPAIASPRSDAAAARAEELARGAMRLHVEPRLGVPAFLQAAPASGSAAPVAPLPPERAARAHLERYAPLYRLYPGDAQGAPLHSVHRTEGGATLVAFGQEVDGVPVFRTRVTLLLDGAGGLLAIGGHLSPSASRLAVAGGRLDFALGADEAVRRARADAGAGLELVHPARASRVAFETGSTIEPAWYLELHLGDPRTTSSELVAYVISARDGRLLLRQSLTFDAAFTYRVYADTQPPFTPWDGPQGTSASPYPWTFPPDPAWLPHPETASNSDVTLQNAPFSKNDPWLPDGATETTGNNVDAYSDRFAPDGYSTGDLRGKVTGPGAFQNSFDPGGWTVPTDAQVSALLQHLFFVVNWLHDTYYDAGFDEAAGNAQADNFGRGGAGGDPVYAEVQHSGGSNNADMTVPSDGASPRMQLYRWGTSWGYLEGAADTGIVAHEWHHLLVGRLVNHSTGSNMSAALHEGFADFGALLLLAREEDAAVATNVDWSGAYSIGGYVMSAIVHGTIDSYYAGTRRFPYSTDFAKDPLTYGNIRTGATLPAAPVQDVGAPDNAEPHNAGEVWATALWECYASLLRDNARLSFGEAQRRMRAYLVAGLKLTPGRPTFLEARDALLAAMEAGDPADAQRCGAAFARRGMGTGARSPTDRFSATNDGLVESFHWGQDVAFVSGSVDDDVTTCDGDHYLDPGERGHLTVRARNTGAGALLGLVATVTAPGGAVAFPAGNVASFPALAPQAVAEANVEVVYTGSVSRESITFDVALSDPSLDGGGAVNASFAAVFNADERQASTAVERFETLGTTWTPGQAGTDPDVAWSRVLRAGVGYVHGPDLGFISDSWIESPPLAVADGILSFKLRHAWDFEADPATTAPRYYYDGGRVEVSTDDGATWSDVGEGAGYNGTIVDYPAFGSALSGQRALVGSSGTVDRYVVLGTGYAGKVIRLRFRIVADVTGGASGWTIERLAFTGLASAPFSRLAPNRGCYADGRPVADAGGDLSVRSAATATLDGGASTAPDAQPLVFAWRQTSGPAVDLRDANQARPAFVAPIVEQSTPLAFDLVVTDARGLASAPSSVTVTVEPLAADGNRPPLAVAADQSVGRLANVTLDASGSSDPDGDRLFFLWVQVAGPPVTLTGSNLAQARFLAPNADATLAFDLAVNDGQVTTHRAVTVTVTAADAGGCGCTTAGDATPVGLLGLFLAAGALRRRRRVAEG